MDFAVTVGKNESPGLTGKARAWSEELGLPFIGRDKGTLDEFIARGGFAGALVATANGPELHSAGGRLFFHPGMSVRRIENLRAGAGDRMVNAMGLKKSMSVLDCTLGLAADACVASWAVGREGLVVGVEAVKPVAFVIREGLANYRAGDGELTEAMRRIRVVSSDALAYLKKAADKSFDIVYFDPMFERVLEKSHNMKPLRPVAQALKLDDALLAEAKRVAAHKVVIKILETGECLPRFLDCLTGDGRYSKLKYAVLEAGG
ncbi:MAG: class I SAM-dependent methyltransferase [Acidaminococcales bacterium]|nr:class I SAM-dependent methyltransferase [Acidaminococcales bacterium]